MKAPSRDRLNRPSKNAVLVGARSSHSNRELCGIKIKKIDTEIETHDKKIDQIPIYTENLDSVQKLAPPLDLNLEPRASKGENGKTKKEGGGKARPFDGPTKTGLLRGHNRIGRPQHLFPLLDRESNLSCTKPTLIPLILAQGCINLT
jgi:hypothetical protein